VLREAAEIESDHLETVSGNAEGTVNRLIVVRRYARPGGAAPERPEHEHDCER
jgi:hypothetical protein